MRHLKKKSFGKKFTIILLIIIIVSYGSAFIIIKNSNFSLQNFINDCLYNPNIHFGFNSYNNYNNSYDLNLNKTHNLNDINTISCDFPLGNISVIPWDGSEVKVTFDGHIRSNENLENIDISFSKEDSTLNIYLLKNNSNLWTPDTLKIYIPKNYNSNLQLSSSTGIINVCDLNYSDLKLDTISGVINLKNITCNNFSSNSVSGNMHYENLTVKNSNINSTSGDIYIDNFSGELNSSTVSGALNLTLSSVKNNIKFNSTSGNVFIYFPSNSSIKFKCSTVSGNISYHSPTKDENLHNKRQFNYILNNGDNSIDISTMSGKVEFNTTN